ncbi:MAG: hypothetical protein AB2809_08520 [Candidatus Thiodiazotropha sp.]
MKIRRDIASVPLRSARETWTTIVDLVTGDGSVDRQQLDDAASIMESLIADEQPANVPVVIKGAGPRIVIYCLYDENAMEQGLDIDPLNTNPTAGEWSVTAPCEEEDVEWMNNALKVRASRISVHAASEAPADTDGNGATTEGKGFDIDWGAMANQ